ncbi:HNH endonuclease [Deinococcus sonorensis]|uniref:HNH endonuclease n=2 Tax=Deinococcus sonorensis TaxID=309891 RepID=A0AAU7U872_9DEIO
MADQVLSYLEMCQREGISLQRGMNFQVRGGHSVVLMSLQPGAPYRDRRTDDGTVLLYEGHDAPRRHGAPDPKTVDQPGQVPGGRPTENGKFYAAAMSARHGLTPPDRVRVYEKLRAGVWAYNGLFHLMDAALQHDGRRHVYVFRLELAPEEEPGDVQPRLTEPRRIIPTHVKVEVYQRDGGRCVVCGSTVNLHFDHVLPYAKGGSSDTAANVQLLCATHNLAKGDRLQ